MQTQQTQLEKTQQRDFKIQASILIAMQRTGTTELNIQEAIKDVTDEFRLMKDERLIQAIRNGSLGKYGKTYKLTTQVICIWIREYLKETNKNVY